MAKRRLPNAPDQTILIVQLPQSLKSEVYSIAKKRGEAAAVVVREFLRRGLSDDAA